MPSFQFFNSNFVKVIQNGVVITITHPLGGLLTNFLYTVRESCAINSVQSTPSSSAQIALRVITIGIQHSCKIFAFLFNQFLGSQILVAVPNLHNFFAMSIIQLKNRCFISINHFSNLSFHLSSILILVNRVLVNTTRAKDN